MQSYGTIWSKGKHTLRRKMRESKSCVVFFQAGENFSESRKLDLRRCTRRLRALQALQYRYAAEVRVRFESNARAGPHQPSA